MCTHTHTQMYTVYIHDRQNYEFWLCLMLVGDREAEAPVVSLWSESGSKWNPVELVKLLFAVPDSPYGRGWTCPVSISLLLNSQCAYSFLLLNVPRHWIFNSCAGLTLTMPSLLCQEKKAKERVLQQFRFPLGEGEELPDPEVLVGFLTVVRQLVPYRKRTSPLVLHCR